MILPQTSGIFCPTPQPATLNELCAPALSPQFSRSRPASYQCLFSPHSRSDSTTHAEVAWPPSRCYTVKLRGYLNGWDLLAYSNYKSECIRRQLMSGLAATNMTRLPPELQILIFGWLFTFEHEPIFSNDPGIFHTQFDVANLRANSLPLHVLGAEIDVPYPRSQWPSQIVPSFDPKRATAFWPSTFHKLMVITLFHVTVYQVDVEELLAFLRNRTLHGDVAPAHYGRCTEKNTKKCFRRR
jgi:hypothetical protein